MIRFELTNEYIELVKLLKILQIADTGGVAKLMVENGEVLRNGKPEFRKRAKIVKKDIIIVAGKTIVVE